MTIEFDDTPFRASHGKAPSGRGSWAFGTEKNPDVCNADKCWFSPGGMTLTEAKRWARAEATKRFGRGASGTLYVLS